jgi:hypothetical protein
LPGAHGSADAISSAGAGAAKLCGVVIDNKIGKHVQKNPSVQVGWLVG